MAKDWQGAIQNSGKEEWWTPFHIIEACRLAMGGIDLDPASTAEANERVQATRFYTRADNGLALPWRGRVFINFPFGGKSNKAWVQKAIDSFQSGEAEAVCVVSFSSQETEWGQLLTAYPRWIPAGRVAYYDPATGKLQTQPPKGSMVTYIGRDVHRFAATFGPLSGAVDVPYTLAISWLTAVTAPQSQIAPIK